MMPPSCATGREIKLVPTTTIWEDSTIVTEPCWGDVRYTSFRAGRKYLQPSPANTTAHDSAATMNRDKKTLMRIVQIFVSFKRLCLKGTCLVRMKDCHF